MLNTLAYRIAAVAVSLQSAWILSVLPAASCFGNVDCLSNDSLFSRPLLQDVIRREVDRRPDFQAMHSATVDVRASSTLSLPF